MTRNILAVTSNNVNLKHLFYIACDVCHYCQNHLLSKTICVIMLYMISKNMKIHKNLKLLKNVDDHDNNDDEKKEKKKKNDNYNLINYIFDDDLNAASASAADSSHAISNQSSSHFVINHFNFFHNISD